MANPQTKDGYTRIANTIMEALAHTRIPGEARQVLDCILRKTYGYNKSSDNIALSQISLMTGLKRPTVCKAIRKLCSMNIITKKDNATAQNYTFIRDFDRWTPLPKKVMNITQKGNGYVYLSSVNSEGLLLPKKVMQFEPLPKKVISVTQKGNPSLPKKVHTKDNTTKDNTTKERGSVTAPHTPAPIKSPVFRKFAHLSISVAEQQKLIDAGYFPQDIEDILDDIENYKKNTSYKSLYLTAKKWLKKERDAKKKQEPVNDKPIKYDY